MKAKHCDFCQFHQYNDNETGPEKLTCKKGHKPRFYMPKDEYEAQWGDNWGWKRRCTDFVTGDHVHKIQADC